MLPVASASALGFKEARKELAKVEAEMTQRGMRLRDRDVLIHTLCGATQKLALTTVTLGHDEAFTLLKTLGLAPNLTASIGSWYSAIFGNCSLLEKTNACFNKPVDVAKAGLGDPKIGESMTAPQIAVIGGAAAAADYGTNRAGEVGRQIRADLERSSAATQRLAVKHKEISKTCLADMQQTLNIGILI